MANKQSTAPQHRGIRLLPSRMGLSCIAAAFVVSTSFTDGATAGAGSSAAAVAGSSSSSMPTRAFFFFFPEGTAAAVAGFFFFFPEGTAAAAFFSSPSTSWPR